MITAFAFCGMSFSMHLNNQYAQLSDINIIHLITAATVAICMFMLMRIADEHKDFEEDSQFRPYRPVQRGLVTLKELRVIGIILVFVQIVLSGWIDLRLIVLLALVYIWFTLMTLEFGVPKWLKAHPSLYLASHMVILAFINLYITAVEWLPRGGAFNFGLLAYMVSSYCDGTVVEVGRKLRAKENEEYGVDTYTHIWGSKRAIVVWMVFLTTSLASTGWVGFQIGVGYQILIVLSPLYIFAAFMSLRFARNPSPKNAKVFEIFPGVWMLLMYVLLGILPFFQNRF